MARRVLLLGVLTLAVVWGGMAALAHGDGDPEHGAALYAEYCLACHDSTGAGRADHEAFGAAIVYDTTFEDVVARGVPDTYMIGYGAEAGGPLSAEDISDLRAYAEVWHGGVADLLPAVVIPEGLAGTAAAGAEVYLTNCAGCHGAQGEGRDLPNFPAIGEHADVLALARRGVAGSAMPPFAEIYGGPLTEAELNSVLEYVRTWERVPEMVAAAEQGPRGAAMALLLIGLGSVALVAGFSLTTNRDEAQ